MLLVILMTINVLERFKKKNCKTNQREFRIGKRKSNKLCVKWKGCDNSFNSWIDEKGIVMEK